MLSQIKGIQIFSSALFENQKEIEISDTISGGFPCPILSRIGITHIDNFQEENLMRKTFEANPNSMLADKTTRRCPCAAPIENKFESYKFLHL